MECGNALADLNSTRIRCNAQNIIQVATARSCKIDALRWHLRHFSLATNHVFYGEFCFMLRLCSSEDPNQESCLNR